MNDNVSFILENVSKEKLNEVGYGLLEGDSRAYDKFVKRLEKKIKDYSREDLLKEVEAWNKS